MVHILYSVTAFVCALVLCILPAKIKHALDKTNPTDKVFLRLIHWITAFCIIDGIWGIFASHLIKNNNLLFVFSTIFHLCAAFTPLMWLKFVITYLREEKRFHIFSIIFNFIFLFQVALLGLNIFNKMMFFVDNDGIYRSTYIRYHLFYVQYITYIFLAIYSLKKYFSNKTGIKPKDYLYVFMFNIAPICAGIFQMIYPDAPAYSIGYMLGLCIIYSFIVSGIINRRVIEKAVYEQLNQTKTEFLFNMSHDIRTPMNAILGYTNVALHSDSKEKVQDSLKKIKISGNHLLSLINEILEMSRIESGKLSISNDPMSIILASEAVYQMSQSLAAPKSICLTYKTKNISNPYILGDELHLNEVLINLVSNAIKYTNVGGSVDFITEQIENNSDGTAKFRFTVKDTGIGMSEEFQNHLFEPFSREQTATVSKQEGAGLGLSIVKKIIDLADGTIKVESQINKGSTFTVELPFKQMNEKQIKKFKKSQIDFTIINKTYSLKDKKILLAEDNAFNKEITIDSLIDTGVIIDSVEDGKQALQKVQQMGTDYYDAILMDIQMPVMNGYEATKEIRKLDGGEEIPIIALSANAFKEDKEKSLAVGMNDHIAKPIKLEELLQAIKNCIK